MSIFDFFIKNEGDDSYKWEEFNEGLIFSIDKSINYKINNGDAEPWVVNQHIALKMLVEEGLAELIPNGFIVPSETVVNLDEVTQRSLELPKLWDNVIKADIQGKTGNSSFSVKFKVNTENRGYTANYEIKGPILSLTPTSKFLLSSAQYLVFSSLKNYQRANKSEYEDLRLLLALQNAKKAGANIDLAHFNEKDIKAPDSVSVEVELDSEGNLILTPFMGQDSSHEKIQKVLGQLNGKDSTSIRVGEEILLFDEERLKAAHEILRNRKIPKDKVKQFIKNPTAFIDGSLVNLDIGFSTRVHGAVKFKHAYFGDTDEFGIDWFAGGAGSEIVFAISKLPEYIKDEDKLIEFKKILDDAYQVGAIELNFEDKYFEISDKVEVKKVLTKIKNILDGVELPSEPIEPPEEGSEDLEPEVAVVDVDLNDEDLEANSPSLDQTIESVLYKNNKLDWSNYLRTPYSWQNIGVRWILGLANNSDSVSGGLLADDMGLGKTFMSLAAVEQTYKINKRNKEKPKPCLVVAPLSLLQNWKDEVAVTFDKSPFKDIVILQSAADLKDYRVGGIETRLQQVEIPLDDELSSDSTSSAEIRFSLKVGKDYVIDRLDVHSRLVITTYQTLRDYQFSLCTVDWGLVIFDEAQNIKNPNALQTRAAKGLKADFKLLATGTPVENSLADFWCLMDTACPGHLGSYQEFRKEFVEPILRAAGDEVESIRDEKGRKLRLRVGSRMLRRIKEDHIEDLPNKHIYVGMEGDNWGFDSSLKKIMDGIQLKAYDATLKTQSESEENIVLSGLHRLKDVSLHPQLADRGQLIVPKSNKELLSLMNESGKMKSLFLTLDLIEKRKEKCIIFAVNKRLQSFLSLALGQKYKLGPLPIINGDTKAVSKKATVPTRKSIIKEFENKSGFNIIVMSPVAAGVGLTIVGANNVIHFERHWNPAKEAQATDRVYRIGQTKDVNVYIPILHHPEYESFDVNLHSLLSKKNLLKDAVVTPEEVKPKPGGMGVVNTPDYRILGENLKELSWQQFEALCAELFKQYSVCNSCHLTPVKDGGADVLLRSSNIVSLIQCKHVKTGTSFEGYSAVQEIISAKSFYDDFIGDKDIKLIFVTNAKKIHSKARSMANKFNVEVVRYNALVDLLNKHTVTYEMVLKRLAQKRLGAI